MNDFDSHLLQQGANLIDLPEETLLEVIGLQLLAIDQPGKAAVVAMHLSSTAQISQIAQRTQIEPSEALLPTSISIIAEIVRQNRQRAEAYLGSVTPKLKDALCQDGKPKDDFRQKFDRGTELIGILAIAVATALGLPSLVSSLTITLAAWLCKTGLDRFCTID